jgi:hypothetical protein
VNSGITPKFTFADGSQSLAQHASRSISQHDEQSGSCGIKIAPNRKYITVVHKLLRYTSLESPNFIEDFLRYVGERS